MASHPGGPHRTAQQVAGRHNRAHVAIHERCDLPSEQLVELPGVDMRGGMLVPGFQDAHARVTDRGDQAV